MSGVDRDGWSERTSTGSLVPVRGERATSIADRKGPDMADIDRGNPTPRPSRRSALAESVIGHVGAFLITYAIAFVLAKALAWAAGRMISIGGGLGTGGIALVALGLTLAFYWYERNNP